MAVAIAKEKPAKSWTGHGPAGGNYYRCDKASMLDSIRAAQLAGKPFTMTGSMRDALYARRHELTSPCLRKMSRRGLGTLGKELIDDGLVYLDGRKKMYATSMPKR